MRSEGLDGGEAIEGGSPASPGSCALRRPPGRPADTDTGAGTDAGSLELTFVARTLRAGDLRADDGTPEHLRVGLDLDGVCTGESKAHACSPPDWDPAGSRGAVDGEDGIDNAAGEAFFRSNEEHNGSATDYGTSLVALGERSYAVRIRGYDGTPDDARVEVTLIAVTTRPSPGARATMPLWNGQDEWLGLEAFFELDDDQELPIVDGPLPEPKYVDPEGYVAGGKLVAHYPRIWSHHGMFERLWLVATLEQTDEGHRLTDGVMGGRLGVDSLLATLGSTYDRTTSSWICTDSPQYETRKAFVCSLADVSYQGPDSRASTCDGVSWAWAFEASLANVVGVAAHEPDQTCAEGKRPGIDDHCDPSLD